MPCGSIHPRSRPHTNPKKYANRLFPYTFPWINRRTYLSRAPWPSSRRTTALRRRKTCIFLPFPPLTRITPTPTPGPRLCFSSGRPNFGKRAHRNSCFLRDFWGGLRPPPRLLCPATGACASLNSLGSIYPEAPDIPAIFYRSTASQPAQFPLHSHTPTPPPPKESPPQTDLTC